MEEEVYLRQRLLHGQSQRSRLYTLLLEGKGQDKECRVPRLKGLIQTDR